jgi:hypothetical protein
MSAFGRSVSQKQELIGFVTLAEVGTLSQTYFHFPNRKRKLEGSGSALADCYLKYERSTGGNETGPGSIFTHLPKP